LRVDVSATVRGARAAVYWLASPFDRFGRRLAGLPTLPPLWLRRHAGAITAWERSVRDTAGFLDRLELASDAAVVLDVGCGPGAMVEALTERLPPNGRYVGFDVHAPSIRWCRRRWSGDSRIRFELAAVRSAYGAAAGPPVSSYRFPLEDGEGDLVLAKSVFTHLLEADARHYLSEIRRVLGAGRPAVVTAFLFDRNHRELEAVRRAFPFEGNGGAVRLRRSARPTAAVAFDRNAFWKMVEDSGLRVVWHSAGFYPGRSRLDAQDVLLLGH
jgi:SAM-dependent methyltransferase